MKLFVRRFLRLGAGWRPLLLGALLLGVRQLSFADGVVTNCTSDALAFALSSGGNVSFTQDCAMTISHSLLITNTVSLNSGGHSVVLSGTSTSSVFTVLSPANLTLSGFTVTGGHATNGGAMNISAGAQVVITNCTFGTNQAAGADGASGSDGNNSSGTGGNGSRGLAGGGAWGGAIFNSGSLFLIGSRVAGNQATGGTGGNGGNGGDGGYQAGNGANGGAGGPAFGGAIYNIGDLTLSNCFFMANSATGGDGGTGGAPGSAPFAGLAGNGGAGAAASGAGVYSLVPITVVNCTFWFNQAAGGASQAGGTSSANVGNNGASGAPGYGGGICAITGGTITNCTFATNSVFGGDAGDGGNGSYTAGNGGNGGNALGGGLFSSNTIFVVNCTFAGGSAFGGTNGLAGSGAFPGSSGAPGAGRGGNVANGGGFFGLKNTILSGGASGTNAYDTASSRITDEGNNVSSDSTPLNVLAGSLRKTAPKLSTLTTNGGFAPTMLLLTGSPAINAGDDSWAPPFDERGVSRTNNASNPRSDIGAVEGVAPTIQTQPVSSTNVVGSTATFSVTATGDPVLRYSWQFNGITLTNATNATLSLTGVTNTNAGNYMVIVSNPYGSVTGATAGLTIITAPVISSQPTNLTVVQGAAAQFAVSATGSGALSYQWWHYGTNVVGATNSLLTVSNVQPADAGPYWVVVSVPGASTTSAFAILQVVASPRITTLASATNGLQFTFSTSTNRSYVLEYKTLLSDPTWIPLVTNAGTGATLTNRDLPTNTPSRFYRVRTQ